MTPGVAIYTKLALLSSPEFEIRQVRRTHPQTYTAPPPSPDNIHKTPRAKEEREGNTRDEGAQATIKPEPRVQGSFSKASPAPFAVRGWRHTTSGSGGWVSRRWYFWVGAVIHCPPTPLPPLTTAPSVSVSSFLDLYLDYIGNEGGRLGNTGTGGRWSFPRRDMQVWNDGRNWRGLTPFSGSVRSYI